MGSLAPLGKGGGRPQHQERERPLRLNGRRGSPSAGPAPKERHACICLERESRGSKQPPTLRGSELK